MATTSYGVNHPLAVKHWAKRLFREALKMTYMGRFMGTSSNALVHLRPETGKEAGDRVRVGLRMQLEGDGIIGDNTLEGNEESLTTYNDDLLINQLRHAVRSAGRMSEQRVPFSVREEARVGLTDWFAARFDTAIMRHLAGAAYTTDTRYNGNNSVADASTGRIVRASGEDADESLTNSTTDVFKLHYLDYALEIAKTASPLIRPVKVNGSDYYVAFLHPYQVTDLRTDVSTSRVTWFDIQKAVIQGGKTNDNPIFNGALGIYNNIVLHESTYVPYGMDSTGSTTLTHVRRAVFCGAQACLMGFGNGYSTGQQMKWEEERFDFGNQLGVAAGSIFGVKKARFNSKDFGTVVISTTAVKKA